MHCVPKAYQPCETAKYVHCQWLCLTCVVLYTIFNVEQSTSLLLLLLGMRMKFTCSSYRVSFHHRYFTFSFHPSRTNYGVSFFQRFNLVLNALDNRQARNHVNRMCLTASVPLIESGTAGYDGQVELIMKGKTQCYECTPKAAQKSFPGCTIRNTPSEPIHCIVWAKHLFK